MKKLFTLAALLCALVVSAQPSFYAVPRQKPIAGGGGGGVTFVRVSSASSAGSPSVTINVTNGNSYIAIISYDNSLEGISGLTSSLGNNLIVITNLGVSYVGVSFVICTNVANSGDDTIGTTTGGYQVAMLAVQYKDPIQVDSINTFTDSSSLNNTLTTSATTMFFAFASNKSFNADPYSSFQTVNGDAGSNILHLAGSYPQPSLSGWDWLNSSAGYPAGANSNVFTSGASPCSVYCIVALKK